MISNNIQMDVDNSFEDNQFEQRKYNWFHRLNYLPSEEIICLDRTTNGNLCLTNYRLILHCRHQSNVTIIPYHLIRSCVSSAASSQASVGTKIAKTIQCQFKSQKACELWIKKITNILSTPKKMSEIFAVSFREQLNKRFEEHPLLLQSKEVLKLGGDTNLGASLVLHEFERLGFDPNSWKITDVNSTFKICKTYPMYHIMPREVSDQDISNMASFRSHNRFPSVVWRSRKNGAVLLRCAQPCVGIMYSRNEFDERFVAEVLANCKKDRIFKNIEDGQKLLIIDARYYSAAQFNRFRGGGFEFGEYYDDSQIRFMALANVHYIRESFDSLMNLCKNPDANWYSKLEGTLWLSYISQLLKAAVDVAVALEVQCRPVMVHCTDGWDRTPQLTSLAELLIDPYYRTIQGFRILVEREWLHFGHKFGDRCGHSFGYCSPEEQSPIFLQWLDCVHQIQHQFPSYFEFNELFLIKLAIHTYSGLFGTFLCNTEFERQENNCANLTCSIWAYLNPDFNWSIINYLYEEKDEMINPSSHICNLVLWDNLYKKALQSPDPCGSLNQPPVLYKPLRRGSDASAPLRVFTAKTSISAETNVINNSSGPPSTTLVAPTSTTDMQTTEADALSITALGAVKQRSRSLSDLTVHQTDQKNVSDATGIEKPFVDASLKDTEESYVRSEPEIRSTSIATAATGSSGSKDPSSSSTEDKSGRLSDKENVNDSSCTGSLSEQNLVATVAVEAEEGEGKLLQPCRHARSGSDPPFVTGNPRRFRSFQITSIGDNETLVVNKAPWGNNDHDDGVTEQGRECEVEEEASHQPVIPPRADSRASATTWSASDDEGEAEGCGSVGSEGDASKSQQTANSASVTSPLSRSTLFLSGAAFDGMKVWIDGYFGPPVYSQHFQRPGDESVCLSETEEVGSSLMEVPLSTILNSQATTGAADVSALPNGVIGGRTRSHTEGEIQGFIHQQKEPPSGQSSVGNVFAAADRRYEFSSMGKTPIVPEHSISVDWDGLPLWIDPVTLKLHERQRQEYHLKTSHQGQINHMVATIANLRQEVMRLRAMVESNKASQNQQHRREEGEEESRFGNLASFDTIDSSLTTSSQSVSRNASRQLAPTTGVALNGNCKEQTNPLSSIVEALSDAIDNHQEVKDFGDYGCAFSIANGADGESVAAAAATAALLMAQSANDDILLNWPDSFATVNGNGSGDKAFPSAPPQRKHCGPSTSSDYSSFDVIDKSAMLAYPAAPGGPVCSGCDRLLSDDVPLHACSNCVRSFCEQCSHSKQMYNSATHMCDDCSRNRLLKRDSAVAAALHNYHQLPGSPGSTGCAATVYQPHRTLTPSSSSCHPANLTPSERPCPINSDSGLIATAAAVPHPSPATASSTVVTACPTPHTTECGMCQRRSPLTGPGTHSQNGTARA